MSVQAFLKEQLTKNKMKISDEDLAEMSKAFTAQYGELAADSKKEANTPRTSTRPDTVQAGRDMADVKAYATQTEQAGHDAHQRRLIDLRKNKVNQDTEQNLAITNSNTNANMQVLGASYADQYKMGLDSKDRHTQGMIDYYKSRDSKYLEAMKGQQQMAQQAGTMDFVGRLLGGALMLAG